MDWLRALHAVGTPSRPSGAILAFTLGCVWALGSVLLAFGWVDPEIGLGGFFLLMGMAVLPAAGVLVGIGGLLNRSWTARGLQLTASACLFGLAGLFLGVGNADELGLDGSLAVSTLFFILPVTLAGGLSLLHAGFAVPELRGEVLRARTLWLTQALDLRGRVDAVDVRDNTGWGLERAEAIADAAGSHATLEADGLRLDRVAARHRERILAMVQTRGRVPLAELQAALGEPRSVLALRIAELRETGDFHGWIESDTLCSRDLVVLRALGACPGCGGELDLAGQGLVTCRSCDAVVYL
ncbi:MAG: hypothetical protein ACI8PZ_004582 [Myxococcota bacterium]|jgi:hypothetical protein